MLRFVLPAFALTAALIVLVAGALGDLHSWPNLSDKARTIIGDVAPIRAPLPPARTAAPPAAAVAEPQAARDAPRRQIADMQPQAGELQQQNVQRSHGTQTARDPDTASQKAEQPSAELQAKRDALQRQIADLQRLSGDLKQQVTQRSQDLEQSSHELDVARSDTKRLRQDIEALERFRKTAEQQMTASARATPTTPGPSAAAAPEQQPPQELRRQNADLEQQVALRSRDLDAARAEASKLRRDIDALNQLRKTEQEQTAAAASARSPAPGPSAAAIAEQQAAQDALRRQVADLQQQVAQRSHELEAAKAETGKLRQDNDALNQLRKTQEQQIAAAGPSAAAIAEQQAAQNAAIAEQLAAQDALRLQIADLQQQVAQRSEDLETANAETGKLRQENDALNQLRETQEQQIAAAAAGRPPAPGPSAAASAEQRAAQEAQRRQIADLQQQVAQRSRDLDAAHAETSKLRQDIDTLNQRRKTQEQQIAAAAAARPPPPGPSAAALAEQQAAQDTLRRQNADLQQQVAQRSHDLDAAHAETGKLRQDIDALNQLRKTQEQQIAAAAAAAARPPAPGPSAAAIAEQQAAQDTLRRQNADLQQQIAQRSHDLDAAKAETSKLRQNIDALNQLRRTQEQQTAAAAAAQPPAPGPSAAAVAEQQAAQDALRHQNADLQQQVAQRSHDLDAAKAETAKLRQDIDTLNQLRKTQEQQIAAAARPPPPRPSAASAEQQAAQDAQRRQIADLQQQVAQRSHDLDSARAETVTLREGLDSSRQQRKLEEASTARQKAQEQQMVVAATRPTAPRPTPPPAQPTPQRVLQAPLAAPTAQPTSASTAAPPMLAPPAEPQPTASPQLLTARQWLASGRPDEARRVLAMVQTRMVLKPVTPDRPGAEGGNPSATDVGNAIRWLDIGANGQAMQAIDRAIGNANAPVSAQQWSGYSPGYSQQGFATSGSSR